MSSPYPIDQFPALDLFASTHGIIKIRFAINTVGPLVAIDKNNFVLTERDTFQPGHEGPTENWTHGQTWT